MATKAESELKPPITEAAEVPGPSEIRPVELSAETQAQMTPEAQSRFAALPERKKGMFAGFRERLTFKKQDPIEKVTATREYFVGQERLAKERKIALGERQGEREAALKKAEAMGARAVEVSHIPDAVEKLLDDPALDAVGRTKLEQTVKEARVRAEKESKLVKAQQKEATERAKRLVEEIRLAENAVERFNQKSEQARDRLDDAAVEAINSTSEQGIELEENVVEINEALKENQEKGAKLDAAISSLDEKIKAAKEPLVIESLKPLLAQARAERAQLKEAERRLTAEQDRHGKQLNKLVSKNEKLVPYLSVKKVEALLDDPEHSWIIPMLSADQLTNLPEDRQRNILKDNQERQKALLPKLSETQLKKLSDAGIVPDKAALLAQGILKKPAEVRPIEEARATRAKEISKERPPKEKAIGSSIAKGEITLKYADGITRTLSGDQLIETFPDGRRATSAIDFLSDEYIGEFMKAPIAELRSTYKISETILARMEKIQGVTTPEAEKPRTLPIADWKGRIQEAVEKAGEGALGVELPDGLEIIDLSSDDVVDIGTDQAIAKAKAEAGGDKEKEEGLIKKVLKELAKMAKELFEFTLKEAEGLIESGLKGRPRTKFDITIKQWNEANQANPAAKIKMEEVPLELHGQELSDASAKLKLMELVKKQESGDPAKVSEFFEHQKREAAPEINAAAA